MKKKITVIGIWLIALYGVAFSFYDLYSYYSDSYHDGATFFDLTMNQELLYWAGFAVGILIALGLILRVKLARLVTLFLSYNSIFSKFVAWILPLVYVDSNSLGSDQMSAIFNTLFDVFLSLLFIYLLTNDEALKLFSIKRQSSKVEIVVLAGLAFLLAVLPSLLYYVTDYLLVKGV